MKKYFSSKVFTLLLATICISAVSVVANPKPKKPKSASAAKIEMLNDALAAMKFKNVQFAFNKTEIPAAYYPTLDKVAKLMVDNDAALKVEGYADNKGGFVYNWKLSKARADAVKEYLKSKGATEARIAATEYGYTKPIASNKTKAGRQKNRRVEVHFAE